MSRTLEKVKLSMNEFLSDTSNSVIEIESKGEGMNSFRIERQKLYLKVTYSPYIFDRNIDKPNIKYDFYKIIRSFDFMYADEDFIHQHYEDYLKTFCKYCYIKDGELIKCLRHHTVSFDLENVITFLTNRERYMKILYNFERVGNPIYIHFTNYNWSIDLFKEWEDLVAIVTRPSGITFQYNNLAKGKSVYSIAELLKEAISFIADQFGDVNVEVQLQINER